MKEYNKLIRDRIPEIIEKNGDTCDTHIADAEEYRAKLVEKLQEEIQEYVEAENIEELADVLEVIDAIVKERGFDMSEIQKVKDAKREKNGGFDKKIILERS